MRTSSAKIFFNRTTLTFRHFGWPCNGATSADAGGACELEKQNEMRGAAQINNELRSKENLS